MLLMPAQINQNHLNQDGTLFFLPGVDAPHVYVRAWALGCFHSLTSTQLTNLGVTKSGRVWRKVPENIAWSVVL